MYPVYYPCYRMPDCLMMHGRLSLPCEEGTYEKVKDYRHEGEKEPQEKKKEEVNKDSLVSGFVPHHNHGSVDYTSYEDGHVHQCLDVTFPPTPTDDGSHVHYTDGYVLFEDGHNHHYKACSGPAIPAGHGMHVHSYDFYTEEADSHRHHVAGVDMPAPGTR